MTITVEIELFSGRPNPQWLLGGSDALSVSEALQSLPTSQAPAPDPGLGYRGFVLTIEGERKPKTAHVYAGAVWFDRDPQTVWEDANSLEQRLLQDAKNRGYGETLQTFGL